MSYQVVEERTITIDGKVVEAESRHKAEVVGDDGICSLEMSLSINGELVYVTPGHNDDDGEIPLPVADFKAALSDLERLSPCRPAPTTEADDISERAAQVVERACEALDQGTAYAQSLAVDLRATMLALIERATRG